MGTRRDGGDVGGRWRCRGGARRLGGAVAPGERARRRRAARRESNVQRAASSVPSQAVQIGDEESLLFGFGIFKDFLFLRLDR